MSGQEHLRICVLLFYYVKLNKVVVLIEPVEYAGRISRVGITRAKHDSYQARLCQ